MDAEGFGGVFNNVCVMLVLTALAFEGWETAWETCSAFGPTGWQAEGEAVDDIPGDCTGGSVGFRETAAGAGAIDWSGVVLDRDT